MFFPGNFERFRVLTCLLLAAVCLPVAPVAGAPVEKLNVLFIAADDLGNVLGRTRPPGLKTPNLDKLAERGVFFERAYCQLPLCNPSRASVMTGLRPDTIGVYDLDRHFRDQRPGAVTLSQLFKNHGWRSERIGKIYHYNVPASIGTDGLDDPPSWHRVINPKGRDTLEEEIIFNAEPHRKISGALSWLAAEGADGEQTDGMSARQAVRLLGQNRALGRPFFLAVGFFRPHTPYVAPKEYFDLYPLAEVPLYEVPEGDRDDIPAAAIPHNIPLPDYGLGKPVLIRALRAYYASVSFVDAQVGVVVDALDRLGLADNTVIVFWSDHGYHLGEHHLWQKRTLFDPSARAPVIIAMPGAKGNGQVCRRVVEFIDLYPTLADLAGLKPPQPLEGRSLRPLLENPAVDWEHPAFTQILRPGDGKPVMGRGVTLGKWRYFEWNEGRAGRELYDNENDPHEIRNLADDPRHTKTIERLRKLFEGRAMGTVPKAPFNPERL